jgi:carbohydrate kinase (thermoresistant glucokinase family)
MIYLVTGVSGVGKTTIGKALAKELHLPFFDADDYHSEANVQKMKNGIPLNDDDRAPWLATLADHIKKWNKIGGAVLACSALKEAYRQKLQVIDQRELVFIFLHGNARLIQQRLQNRSGHYMPPRLLDSQLETLEVPDYGIQVDVSQPPDQILHEILGKI